MNKQAFALLFSAILIIFGSCLYLVDRDDAEAAGRARGRRIEFVGSFQGDEADGGDASADGGDVPADGGDALADGGDALPDGGDAQADGGDALPDGGDAQADGGDAAAADGGDASFSNAISINTDGVDETIVIPDNAAMEPGAHFSFCVWAREDTIGSPDEFLDKFAAGQTAVKFRKTTSAKLRIDLNSTSNSCSTTSNIAAITSGTWYHACMVFDGTGATDALKLQHYVNGVAQACTFAGTIPTSITNTTSTWTIGGGVTGAWGPGYLDEPVFYNTSLSAADILTLYNSGHPTTPSFTGLTAYYPFDGDTFPTATNHVVGGSDGTYTNMESGDRSSTVP